MRSYVVLLRGVNVGGKSRVVMSELKEQLGSAGYQDVQTYINSGNILLKSVKKIADVTADVQEAIRSHFGVDCDVLSVERSVFIAAVHAAPDWWGAEEGWKHNALFVIPPTAVSEVVAAIGQLKPGIEKIAEGDGVIFQSMLFEQFGKTATGKLASNAIYKRLTIRNYNTTQKLVELLKSY